MKVNYDNDCVIIEATRPEYRKLVRIADLGRFEPGISEDDRTLLRGLIGVLQDMEGGRVPRDDIMEVTI